MKSLSPNSPNSTQRTSESLLNKMESFLEETLLFERAAFFCIRATFTYTLFSIFHFSQIEATITNHFCVIAANIVAIAFALLSKKRGMKVLLLSIICVSPSAYTVYQMGIAYEAEFLVILGFIASLGFGTTMVYIISIIMQHPRLHFREPSADETESLEEMKEQEKERFRDTKRIISILAASLFLLLPMVDMYGMSEEISMVAMFCAFFSLLSLLSKKRLAFFGVAIGAQKDIKAPVMFDYHTWIHHLRQDSVQVKQLSILVMLGAPFFMVMGQIYTAWYFQGFRLNRSFYGVEQLSPIQLIGIMQLFGVFTAPLVDKMVNLKKSKVAIQTFIGVLFISIAAALAVGVENVLILCKGAACASSSKSHIMVQVPQYICLGIGEAFLASALLNVAYMKSKHKNYVVGLVTFSCLTIAGSFLNILFVGIFNVNLPKWLSFSAIACCALMLPLTIFAAMSAKQFANNSETMQN